jgi:hypothetical protein
MSFVDRLGDSPLRDFLGHYLNTQEGSKLGSPEAREILNDDQNSWLYDRTTGMILVPRSAHPNVAAILYHWHKLSNTPCFVDYDIDSERYIHEGLGWWLSSVSYNKVLIGPDIKLNAQEKMAFRKFEFLRME